MNLTELLQERFDLNTKADRVNAIKRLIQELTLIGLSRAKFFEHASFYGGTALRIFYGLPRFSEDLDFTLLNPQPEFTLKPYFQAVKTELNSLGFEVSISEAAKRPKTNIESAFIKADSRLHLLKIGIPEVLAQTAENEVIKVKFEVDTCPPHAFENDNKYLLTPIPCNVRVVVPEQMFAGKMHAILCRKWKNRVKGRDWYDLVWFVSKKIKCPIKYLESRMRQSGHWTELASPDSERIKQILKEMLLKIDLKAIKSEASLFVDNPAELKVWSIDFFNYLIDEIVWT